MLKQGFVEALVTSPRGSSRVYILTEALNLSPQIVFARAGLRFVHRLLQSFGGWRFLKIRGPFLGPPLIRIIVLVLYWVPLNPKPYGTFHFLFHYPYDLVMGTTICAVGFRV